MVNIVAIVLAMVLMVIVVAAGIAYIGPMFTDNSARIQLATYLNRGAQIHGALRLYEAENNGVEPAGTGHAQVESLVTAGYLKEVPDGMWSIDTQMVYRDIGTQNTCTRLNAAANMDLSSPKIVAYHGCPPCNDLDFSGYPACTKDNGTAVVTGGN